MHPLGVQDVIADQPQQRSRIAPAQAYTQSSSSKHCQKNKYNCVLNASGNVRSLARLASWCISIHILVKGPLQNCTLPAANVPPLPLASLTTMFCLLSRCSSADMVSLAESIALRRPQHLLTILTLSAEELFTCLQLAEKALAAANHHAQEVRANVNPLQHPLVREYFGKR